MVQESRTGLTTEGGEELVHALWDLHPQAGWREITAALTEMVAPKVRPQNRGVTERLQQKLHPRIDRDQWDEVYQDVQRVLDHQSVLDQRNDPMMRVILQTVNVGTGAGIHHLTTHSEEPQTVLAELLARVGKCGESCCGAQLAAELVLEGRSEMSSAVRAGFALCSAVARPEELLQRYPTHLDFLRAAGRSGFAASEWRDLQQASRLLETQEESIPAHVLETYHQLVLDGTEPSEALSMARVLD